MPFPSPTMTPLLLLSLTSMLLSLSTTPNTLAQAICHTHQRHALLQLRQGFKTDQLQSWNAITDCCTWDGVTCDQLTGLVTQLDLSNRSISGELNPALFNLTSLQYLNLAYNLFENIPVPQTGFEQLTNLTNLNLSSAGFSGKVPFSISALTNLVFLDLSSNLKFPFNGSWNLELHDPDLRTLLRNLTNLRVLYLDGVNISSNGSEWGKAISQASHTLEELSMTYCSVTGPIDPSLHQFKQLKVLLLDGNNLNSHVPLFFANFSSLSLLSLSRCGLMGQFPDEIFHLTNLTDLDLSYNFMLSGQLPEFKNKSFLQHLSLSFTNFTGPLPDSIGNLQYLSTLDLSLTNFTSPIPASIGNLQKLSTLNLVFSDFYGEVPASIANLTRLEFLNFKGNRFTGLVPMSLFSHPYLKSLYLRRNQFTGYLSEFSNGSLSLINVDLSDNNLQGELPMSLFKLPQLSWLHLRSNNFTGTFNLDILNQSKSLTHFDLSNNNLLITEGQNHSKSFYDSFPQINYLNLSSCSLTKFPSFLQYQTDITDLDLSNNRMYGVIPNWLWSIKALCSVYLSHNFITEMEWGESFISHEYLDILDIHSNMITGSIPPFPPQIGIVDFSFNQFSLWPSHFAFPGFYLYLSNNRLTGEIPLSICKARNLEVLDLAYNSLTGTVPHCLLEGSIHFEVVDLKSNKLDGTFPRDINHECGFGTINLSGNRIRGSLPQSLANCNHLEVLDLGNNQISDAFPYFLRNLQNLVVLVLGSNQFYGTIANMETNHKVNKSFFHMLKVLDLSSNNFSGTLPEKFFGFLNGMMINSDTIHQTILFHYSGDMYYKNSVTVTFKGQKVDEESSLGIFSSLDLSNNRFWGEIPKEIGQLKVLNLLNLSRNTLTGLIPSQFANLKKLESLDLSFNQLSGHIPQELKYLTFLSALNLSYNNLVGEIPQAGQFLTFTNSSYLGNPGLCGSPISRQCGASPSNHGLNELHSKISTEMIGLSVSIGVGLGAGFALVIWTLVSWQNGRKWFNFHVDRFYFRHLYQRKFLGVLFE